ncbi:hypothetical protein BN8_p06903 (plasmid) [Fibrisoma limi BUZ 3]|uniref:Mobilization protein n=1 Tax=Fibrisoma limi BUZ 3 TaxID=1185876 RepID=I2GU93_9BACT|nr:DUF5712 family protein [Fibrisoma limi]CCH57694.1 hypothetical protein BN8_p06903 [Fibrisoma limi BUZ 3]
MQTKFGSPIKGNNKGSCTRLTTYLEKENDNKLLSEQEYFFSADRDKCNKYEVISQIDNNAKNQGLENKDDRFYSIIISPSQKELEHIGNDSQKLKDYTREVMSNYARNFCNSKGENRNLESENLVWYAKIENERRYNNESPEVKTGQVKSGELKEGDQRHIHIIISRCQARENRFVIEADKNKSKERTTQLSPMVNNQKVFNRDKFYKENEQSFDNKFNYKRSKEESYDYCNSLKNGFKKDYDNALQKDQIRRSKDRELENNKQLTISM